MSSISAGRGACAFCRPTPSCSGGGGTKCLRSARLPANTSRGEAWWRPGIRSEKVVESTPEPSSSLSAQLEGASEREADDLCFRGVDLGVIVDFFLDLSDLDGLLLALLLNLQTVSLFQAVVVEW